MKPIAHLLFVFRLCLPDWRDVGPNRVSPDNVIPFRLRAWSYGRTEFALHDVRVPVITGEL